MEIDDKNWVDIAEEKLRIIIDEKLNTKSIDDYEYVEKTGIKEKYDGFEMSGYNEAYFKNLGLLDRFKSYMCKIDKEDRKCTVFLPFFWKGCCDIIKLSIGGKYDYSKLNLNLGGKTTPDILFKLIILNNPDILKDIIKEEKELYENISKDVVELSTDKANEVKEIFVKKYIRDYTLVKKLKDKHSICQLCGFTFKKKNGDNYNEIHHIIPLSEKGKDEEINTLVLCANCHRKLHYAKVDLSKLENKIIIINGVENKIK